MRGSDGRCASTPTPPAPQNTPQKKFRRFQPLPDLRSATVFSYLNFLLDSLLDSLFDLALRIA